MYEKIILVFLLINIPVVVFYNPITKKINLYDYGDQKRKFQKTPVALIGGLLLIYNLIFFSIISQFIDFKINYDYNFTNTREYFSFFGGLILFTLIGLYDDKFNLSANKKLLINFFLILFLILLDDNLIIKQLSFSFLKNSIELKNISYFFTILSILLFINALNMFDGINLQAATYSIIIFLIFLFKDIYIFFSLIIILTLLIFLFYNFLNKAFLGDSGTLAITFVISYFIIKSHNIDSNLKPEEIFVFLAFPGLDMFRLFIFRILNGNNPFNSDINHMHHLISRRFNNLVAFFIIQSIIILSILLYYLIENKLMVISTIIMSYVFIFLIFKKESINN